MGTSDKLLESTDSLYIALLEEAASGIVVSDEGGGTPLTFSERIKLGDSVTRYLVARERVAPEDPDEGKGELDDLAAQLRRHERPSGSAHAPSKKAGRSTVGAEGIRLTSAATPKPAKLSIVE